MAQQLWKRRAALGSASGNVTLRVWAVDDRLFFERLSVQRETR